MGCGRGAGDDGRGNAPTAQPHYLTAVFKKCSVQSGQGRRHGHDRPLHRAEEDPGPGVNTSEFPSFPFLCDLGPSPWLEKDPAEGSGTGEGGREGAERRGREGAREEGRKGCE